jgi:hypothetical protein
MRNKQWTGLSRTDCFTLFAYSRNTRADPVSTQRKGAPLLLTRQFQEAHNATLFCLMSHAYKTKF